MDTEPIIKGSAVEFQPHKSASSTRQELLGQLAIQYWLRKLQEEWGVPRNQPEIILITDSQARIDILKSAGTIIGIKYTMKPEMDVVLEIHQQQNFNWAFQFKTEKVQSQIDITQAPDPFTWECNEIVDELATKARSNIESRNF